MEKTINKRKVTVAVLLIIALALQAVEAILMPQARQYAQEWFVSQPVYLLQYVVRPAAIVLLGLAVVEAVRELVGIRIWSGKSDKSREIVRIVFYVLAVCLSVAALLTLWMGVEMLYQWYLLAGMLRAEGSFDLSTLPHLMPEQLFYRILHFNVLYLDRLGIFGGVCFFLGAAVAFCRMEKGESEKESENRMG